MLRRLYRLDIIPVGPLGDHEETSDVLIQNLLVIGKVIDVEELIILNADSLPVETFGNQIQKQMALIDKISITDPEDDADDYFDTKLYHTLLYIIIFISKFV